ncbi:MAG: hypothetical protein DMG91_17140 [Acidobacteria bacterium]|nr:MAG: hypothetical protein DMG91_17140 [Acidobacteriota bacterium]
MTILNQSASSKSGRIMSWLRRHLPEVVAASTMAAFALIVISCSSKQEKPATAEISAPEVAASTPEASATPVATPTPKKVKKHRPTTATYVNSDYGISVTYPRKYTVNFGDDAQAIWPGLGPVASGFGNSTGATVATIELPGNMYRDTDFATGFLKISVNKQVGREQCEQFAMEKADDAVQSAAVKVGANDFHEVETTVAENLKQGNARYYHAFENDACYEFAIAVETSRDGADDSTPQVDRTDVFRKLERVLATVRIKPIEKQKEGEDVHDVVGGSPESPATSEPASTLLSSDKL